MVCYVYCVDNVILALTIRFTFIRSDKWANNITLYTVCAFLMGRTFCRWVNKMLIIKNIPELVRFFPWHPAPYPHFIITKYVTSLIVTLVVTHSSHHTQALMARGVTMLQDPGQTIGVALATRHRSRQTGLWWNYTCLYFGWELRPFSGKHYSINAN